jgi:hypothetical protein
MSQTAKQVALTAALNASRMATARVVGMKLRAQSDPPRAAVGKFPYPHRTCAEWEELPTGEIRGREMTPAERRKDAKEGSARLRSAIKAMAA